MVRSKRTAFTLVELLVVISIIGMLMAILLPAVGAATEAARAAQCKNAVKNIALAMVGFESRNQSFPGYVDGFERGTQPIPYSWVVAILPEMERQDVYDQYGTVGFEAPYLDFFVCPSDPPLDKQNAHISYVANAGFAEADAAGCGVVHTAWPIRAKNGKKVIHQKTSADAISAGDGSSTTILLSENIQAKYWGPKDEDTPTTDYLSFFDRNASAVDIPAVKTNVPANVMIYHNREEPGDAFKVNSKVDTSNNPWLPTAPPTLVNARPSSEHRGGVNVAFADGHVEFLKEDVQYSVYARLLSPDGKKCFKNVPPGSNGINHTVILSDTDYK